MVFSRIFRIHLLIDGYHCPEPATVPVSRMIPLKSVIVFACLVSGGLSLLGTVSKRGLDNPSPENFVRRFFATVAVLGDYVYIDGGEVSQLIDDVLDAKHSTYLG